MASRTLAKSASTFSVSSSRKSTIARCSHVGGNGINTHVAIPLPRPQAVQEHHGMRTSRFNPDRIDLRQQLKRNLALGVSLRTICSRSLQCIEHRRLRHCLQGGPASKCAFHEARAEKGSHRIAVGQKPGFHGLHHQKCIIIAGTRWFEPTVMCVQMLPDRMLGSHRNFAIDEKERKGARSGSRNFRRELLERLFPRATPHYPRHTTAQAGGCEEPCPALAELRTQSAIVASTFDVERERHHRFPPNCPELQRCPRVYSFNHLSRSTLSSRRISVCPLCFSQTTTLSGVSVSASTSTSE